MPNVMNIMNIDHFGPGHENYHGPGVGACKRRQDRQSCYRDKNPYDKNDPDMKACKQDKNECGELNPPNFQNRGRKTRYRHNRSHNRGRSRSRSHKRRRVSRRS